MFLKPGQSFRAPPLADPYDVDAMATPLLQAHRALNRAVDRLYRGQASASDRERVEHLFTLYERPHHSTLGELLALPL
jgi:hypothetical protein